MTIKVNPNTCPKCGATIPNDAPQGLCPKCVLLGAATATESGLPPAATLEIPPLDRVAAAFPHLEIIELLGRGGMGFVFKARQPNLDRFVALKLLPEKLARDPQFAERFTREARVLARLNHPGIVSIFDFGQTGGFYYLLMEYVDGVNLRQAMQAGKFSPAAALAVVPKICEALQYAHDQGVLHRDIKPANILLDAKGRVKIADFGIAKLVGEEKPDLALTATGAAIGTPQYMAPEQLETPASVDHRADIYSLGVVFYEMLTGELPIGRFAPPSQRTPVDPRVDEVVMRTLEKEREKRYQSAGDVKTKVEHLTQAPVEPGAAAPAFDPAQDFILCPPRLPRMAKAIIVYALLVAPALWLVSLFTFTPLPDHALVAFVEGAVNFLVTTGEFLVLTLLAIGGWKLRALNTAAPTWLKCSIWLHLILAVLAIGGYLWVAILESDLLPDAPGPQVNVGDGVVLAIALASMVFEISALVWLRRHREMLEQILRTATRPQDPRGTIAITPDAVTPAAKERGILKWVFLAVLVSGVALALWPRLREPQQTRNSASTLAPLPDGVVELVAMTREPSDGVWWKADGTPATEGTFEKHGAGPQVGAGERAVVFIFRSRDSERWDASRTYDLQGAKTWISGVQPRLNGRVVSGGSFVTATFPDSLLATTVRVGVAIDTWETVARDSREASRSIEFTRFGKTRKVAFLGAVEDKAGDTILTLTHNLPEEDVRILAVDDEGIEHASTTQFATGERRQFTLPRQAPLRIREYQFQVRPYRWAEFKEVQLTQASSVPVRAPLTRSAKAANTNGWMNFTFTAVELREVEGKRWLAIDYLDDVQGDCQKSFPWESNLPGFKPEVRTSEFVLDAQASPGIRHQRVEYLLPETVQRGALEDLRRSVERALKQKTIRLGLGEQKVLFEFGSSSDTALKAWIKVGSPQNP